MKRILYVALLLTTLYLIKYTTSTTKKTAGFYCRDPKISHTFEGDTVPWKFLLGASLICPLIVITAIEIHLSSTFTHSSSKRIFNWYANFLVGAVLDLIIIEILKTLIAEHRPHFFHTCQPDRLELCKEGEYITEYICQNNKYDERFQRDSLKSFPSGHTSLSVYVGSFCAIYLIRRLVEKPLNATVDLFLKFLCLAWPLLCSLSRITDHRHHWWDVLTGFLIGILVVHYITKYWCENSVRVEEHDRSSSAQLKSK